MATTAGISRNEWLKALGEAEQLLDPSALTVAELAVILGLERSQTFRKARRLVEEGKATKVWKVVEGRKVPAYKLKGGK